MFPPVTTDGNPFNWFTKENTTLHVPSISLDYYKTTSPWNEWFKNIIALTDSDPKPSAINTVTVNRNQDIKYYSIGGKTIDAPQKGIYIIKYGDGTTRKVIKK